MSLIRFMPPRGTAAQANAYVGTLGELFTDTTAWQLRMSDGVTPGGHVQGGISNLIGCSDVLISSPADGQYLRYNGTAGKWENVALAASDLTGTLAAGQFPALTGDVTTTAGALAATIAAGAVSLTKMANLPASTIIGNSTGSSAAPNALSAATVRTLLALVASATTDTTNASNITSGTLPAAQLPAHTGDVTSPAGSAVNTIAAAAVTLAKMANLAANSFIGNNTGSAATPIALSPSLAKSLLAIAAADVAAGSFGAGAFTMTGGASTSLTLSQSSSSPWSLILTRSDIGTTYDVKLFNNGSSTNGALLESNCGFALGGGIFLGGSASGALIQSAQSAGSAYGCVTIDSNGAQGGYTGLCLNTTPQLTFMASASGGGIYAEAAALWALYFNGSTVGFDAPLVNRAYSGTAYLSHITSGMTSGKITVQSGGSASGGAAGDIFFIY